MGRANTVPARGKQGVDAVNIRVHVVPLMVKTRNGTVTWRFCLGLDTRLPLRRVTVPLQRQTNRLWYAGPRLVAVALRSAPGAGACARRRQRLLVVSACRRALAGLHTRSRAAGDVTDIGLG